MRLWSKFKDEMSDENSDFEYFPFDKDVLGKSTKAKEILCKIIVSTAKITKSDAPITKDKKITILRGSKRFDGRPCPS